MSKRQKGCDCHGLSFRSDRMVDVYTTRCNYGNCVSERCVKCDWEWVGMGPMECPCDLTRGWNRSYLDQMGKPHPPIKVKNGRHKGRVEARKREIAKYRKWRKRWLQSIASEATESAEDG